MPAEVPRRVACVASAAASAGRRFSSGVVLELPLYAVAGLPLRAGWAHATRRSGAKVFVDLRYVLEGAQPSTDLTVRLLFHLFDPTCTNTPIRFSSTHIRTDRAGGGTATVSIRPEEVPASVRGAEHGFRLEVAHGESVVYRTDCTAARID